MNKQIFLNLCCIVVINQANGYDEVNLEGVEVVSSQNNAVSTQGKFSNSTNYSREALDNIPKGDGTISDIVKRNPNARISRNQRTSANGGEIQPQNISINGAEVYQNNFIVDGISVNNDINPLGKDITVGEAANLSPFLPNPSQGMNIDTDLLESIEVMDSSVSAKYGGFQGGVINAKTRDPRAGFHGKINYLHTEDSWQKFHIDDKEIDDFEYATNPDYQPDFKKHKYGITLEGFLNDDFGLIFNYNQTLSYIWQRKYSTNYEIAEKRDEKRKLERKNENIFLKAVWFANDRLTIRPSITYAPYEASYYSLGGYNAGADVKGGGLIGNLEADYAFDIGNLTQNFSYNTTEMSRTTDSDRMFVWYKTKDMQGFSRRTTNTIIDGVGGDVDQKQDKISYSADMKFNEVYLGDTSHGIITGLYFDKTKATYDIKEPYFHAVSPVNLGKYRCLPGDIFCSEAEIVAAGKTRWRGQYFKEYNYYKGNVDVEMKNFAFYLEDEMNWKNFTLRPGFRVEKNDYMGDWNIAPRLSANWDIFGDNDTNIFGGYNRYYGRSIFAYKLKAGMNSLKTQYKRDNPNSQWELDKSYAENYNYNKLDVPYDDEYALGISQNINDSFLLSLKYLKRYGNNLIRKTNAKNMNAPAGNGKDLTTNYSFYTNEGESRANIYTIKLGTIKKLEFLNTKNSFNISYNYTDTNRNYNNYDDMFDNYYNDAKKVVYNGNLIHTTELPQNTNDTPWTTTATVVTEIPRVNLTMANFFTLQGGYDAVVIDGKTTINGETYTKYKDKKIDEAFAWDMKFIFDMPMPKQTSAYISLDINNVLDEDNIVDISDKGISSYGAGRQFWLEVGYKW